MDSNTLFQLILCGAILLAVPVVVWAKNANSKSSKANEERRIEIRSQQVEQARELEKKAKSQKRKQLKAALKELEEQELEVSIRERALLLKRRKEIIEQLELLEIAKDLDLLKDDPPLFP